MIIIHFVFFTRLGRFGLISDFKLKMVRPLVRLRDLLNLWGLREVALFYVVNLRQNTWSTNEKFDG